MYGDSSDGTNGNDLTDLVTQCIQTERLVYVLRLIDKLSLPYSRLISGLCTQTLHINRIWVRDNELFFTLNSTEHEFSK